MSEQPGVGAFSQATGRGLEDDSGEYRARYRAYQFELISAHCGRSVLEVGAGLGEFATQFCGLERLIVTDVDPDCVAQMRHRFADRPEVEARLLDLEAADPNVGAPVSSVVAINVLEHIDADSVALKSLAQLVAPGGTIVLWVPGYMQLYGEFDRLVGHVRRYTPATLSQAILDAGLEVQHVRPVNLLGGLAWWLAVRRGKVGQPDPRLLRLYDQAIVPTTRTLERWMTPPFGQSVLGVAKVSDGL